MDEDHPWSDKTNAEAYLDIALGIADMSLFRTRGDVRAWLEDQKYLWKVYEVSQEQANALVYLCREVARDLPEDKKEKRR